MSSNLTKIQRKERLLDTLMDQGHIEVRQASERFDVSEATIRRDLRTMADEGLMELVYGGATLPRKGNYSFRSRKSRNMEAKRLIGKTAAALVRDGDSLFIDSGTTAECMVPHLLARKDLNIITNSNIVAATIGEQTQFQVLQLGGKFRYERMDSVGPFAEMVMQQLSGYRCFIGADGLGQTVGLSSTDVETAHLYKTAILHASETILLADHTKFGAPALYKIVGMEAVHRVVTDRMPTGEWPDFLNRLDIEIIVAESLPQEMAI